MARLLILRDEAAARATATRVRLAGHEPVILPVQGILPLSPAMPAGPLGGIVATSTNAVPFLAGRRFAGPVLAVGEATATALHGAGFADIRTGTGTGAGLADEAAGLFAETGKPLLYLAGRVRTEGLQAALEARGVPLTVIEVYDTVQIDPTDEAIERAVGAGRVDAALLLSAGQATGFARLHRRAEDWLTPTPALLCLSGRIAEALPGALRPAARIAERPELSTLPALYPARMAR